MLDPFSNTTPARVARQATASPKRKHTWYGLRSGTLLNHIEEGSDTLKWP